LSRTKENAMSAFFTRSALAILPLTVFLVPGRCGEPSGYQKPPEAIRRILDLPPPPVAELSPDRHYLVLAEPRGYPSIAEISQPFLRLAGLRINPRTNGPQLSPRFTGFEFVPLLRSRAFRLKVPEGARLGSLVWSDDSSRFAVANTTDSGIELWLGSAGNANLHRVPGVTLNGARGEPIRWVNGTTLLCKTVPKGRGAAPAAPTTPTSPVIQESAGKAGPAWTFQDLLRNAQDEALFDYYCTSQLVLVDVEGDRVRPLGKSAVFDSCRPSPDGRHFLVVKNHRPYSYVLPATMFPKTVEVWDSDGKIERQLAERPLADRIPIDGVETGPREHQWRPTALATVVWAEALDGGDPKKKAEYRDRVLASAAPFDRDPVELAKTGERFAGLTWGEKGVALLADFQRERRRRRVFLIDADSPGSAARLLWDRAIQDRYRDPGTPLTRRRRGGVSVLRQHGDDIFLVGPGASPKGSRPFLDRFNLETMKATRLFQSAADCYETPIDISKDDGSIFVTSHQSPTSPPNYRIRVAGKDGFAAYTTFTDPAPELRKIKRQLVTYKRDDGVNLSFTLYLPPDYKEGTRLPTVVWAYPREFTDPALAGQVAGTPMQFTRFVGTSHLFFLLAGYAVLDGATMPVVGTLEKANDTFVEQIVSSAKAAIDKAVEMGVTDRNRVGVGGHSYGAFMTANLLAHSDLFRAGIARSGAYNRTLTPFGFQSERRTLWQAPDIYVKLSPFMYADKIKAPILLIHGQADNNSGTFPMQSDRLYQAIRGNGGTVRYVSLPHESHGYSGRESVEHTLYEMIAWFDRHVKGGK
jgi:dipeptidyl aminopeptidase/acylaminoacyl peptidase